MSEENIQKKSNSAISLSEIEYDLIKGLKANATFPTIADALKAIINSMVLNNHSILVDGVYTPIKSLITPNIYSNDKFKKLRADGYYSYKFINNFNSIKNENLKDSVFLFMAASFRYIEKTYLCSANVGTNQNISIYNAQGDHLLYIKINNLKNNEVWISKYVQLKLKTTGCINNTLWNKIENFMNDTTNLGITNSYPVNDVTLQKLASII